MLGEASIAVPSPGKGGRITAPGRARPRRAQLADAAAETVTLQPRTEPQAISIPRRGNQRNHSEVPKSIIAIE